MLASKKCEERLQDTSGTGGFHKSGFHKAKLNNLHHPSPDRLNGGGSNNSDKRMETTDKKVFKAVPKKNQMAVNRIRAGPKPVNKNSQNSINKYRLQIRKFIQSMEEYKKLEGSLKTTYEHLVCSRKEIMDSLDIDPGDVPEVQSSIHDLVSSLIVDSPPKENQSRLRELERECSEIKEAFSMIEEEKKKLEEDLNMMTVKLKYKEEELIKAEENDRLLAKPLSGEGDIDEVEMLKRTVIKLDKENSDLVVKLREMKGEFEKPDDKKIRSLEKLIENLHVEIKKLKDQLKVEKESKHKLETENDRLSAEVNNLKSLSTSLDSKYILLEKDQKIQDLQKRLNEISRVRPHEASNQDVFKVDFSADTPSLVTQLARFVQLYEEVAREGFDLESKLKEAHVEIYRLEQILEKQLTKIKEQDECLKNMEGNLNKVVLEKRKDSRSEIAARKPSNCKCEEFENLIKEKEEFSETLKEKMRLLYQKYKQYKSECNLMKQKLDVFEKKSWLKKLVNI